MSHPLAIIAIVLALLGTLAAPPPDATRASHKPPTLGAFAPLTNAIGDPANPSATATLADPDTPLEALTFSATSTNPRVAPSANVTFRRSGSTLAVRVTPVGVGYTTLRVTVSDGAASASSTLAYAASLVAGATPATRFGSGMSGASTAIALDGNTMLVGDDDSQALRLFARGASGPSLRAFDPTPSLGLHGDTGNGASREVDIEASARSGNRIYWLGSHSNASGGDLRPDRGRLFATNWSPSTGALAYVGRYDNLRADLVQWDRTGAHGKGANYYKLAKSTDRGAGPEDGKGGGFNIEGAEFAPDGTTLYVAFRAPLVPPHDRHLALIVPVLNASALVAGNPARGPAQFGAPIELDLGGRAVREIRKNAANQYLIIAGPPAAASRKAPNDFRLFTWSGIPADAPVEHGANLDALSENGSPEAIVEVPSPLTDTSRVQLLLDSGNTAYYGDKVAADNLPIPQFKKFRSDVVVLGAARTR